MTFIDPSVVSKSHRALRTLYRLGQFALLATTLAFAGCASGGHPSPGSLGPKGDCRDQSPRRLERFNTVGKPATVAPGRNDTVIYTPNGGQPTTLLRCGQHYHCWIENLQPQCRGQHATSEGGPPKCPALPPVDSWIEVHTVYSSKVGTNCDPETLNCCVEGPIVVMGHHAKVTADSVPGPTPVLWGPPSAEWTGSNTSPDEYPNQCKSVRAQWSFALGCEFEVSQGRLSLFTHPEPARGLQPPARLSQDLNLVPAH